MFELKHAISPYGQLGLGDLKDRGVPTFVMEGVKSVFSGANRTYIVKMDDSLWLRYNL